MFHPFSLTQIILRRIFVLMVGLLAFPVMLDGAARTHMGEAARATVRTHAGLDQVLNRLVQLYRGERLLAHGAPAHNGNA